MNTLETTPRILVTPASPAQLAGDSRQAWRGVSWFALVLTLAGVSDWILAWMPLRLGSPEWEFGTVVASFAGLPLISIGFAGLLAAAVARGIRWQIIVISWMMLTFAVWIAAAGVLFLLDVPVALRAVQGIAQLGIMKAIVKTALMATLFLVAFVVAGVGALRRLRNAKTR